MNRYGFILTSFFRERAGDFLVTGSMPFKSLPFSGCATQQASSGYAIAASLWDIAFQILHPSVLRTPQSLRRGIYTVPSDCVFRNSRLGHFNPFK